MQFIKSVGKKWIILLTMRSEASGDTSYHPLCKVQRGSVKFKDIVAISYAKTGDCLR